MEKIVVAKLSRLGKDGNKFSKEFKKELRSNVKISEDYVKEFNKNWKTRGQFYEIDKEATEKRNSQLKGVDEIEVAREKYKEKFGEYPDGRMKLNTINKKLKENEV